MANRAYLYNSNIQSNNPESLELALERDGKEYIQIDGSAYDVPFSWLCCFRQSDLRPFTLKLEADDGTELRFEIQIPVTSVENAIKNLVACRPRYEKLVGNTESAKEYWQLAIDAVKAFPFQFLTINIDEILCMGGVKESADLFVEALSDRNDPIPGLSLITYDNNVLPFTLDEFYEKSSDQLEDDPDYETRSRNSITLDWFARGSPDYWWWHVLRTTPNGTRTAIEMRKSSKVSL